MITITELWGVALARVSEGVLLAAPVGLFVFIYWGLGSLMLLTDLYEPVAEKWWSVKFQRKPRDLTDWAMVSNVTSTVGRQQLFVYPAVAYLGLPFMKTRFSMSADIPPVSVWLLHIFCCAIAAEIYFYYCHRLLHHPALYKHFHTMHHEYTAPIGFEAFYFHWVESVLQVGTLMLGPMVMGSHILVVYLWTALAITTIMIHHSGCVWG
jgi:sterol desaturase/sphingolipid hydroxylase (fatty acid hydroxylase superfamily)